MLQLNFSTYKALLLLCTLNTPPCVADCCKQPLQSCPAYFAVADATAAGGGAAAAASALHTGLCWRQAARWHAPPPHTHTVASCAAASTDAAVPTHQPSL
jgi:hypothetical protein